MRTALVTGVTQGLGYHICHHLRDAGYRVLGIARAENPGHGAVDAYRAADLGEALDDQLFPGESVDVLINNASVYLDDPRRGYGDMFALDAADLRQTFEINLFAAVQLVQRYTPDMIRRGRGRVVNVSSGMGRLRDADGASFAYRSSKLALNSLTLAVAHHFAEVGDDLAALSYCPGWIRTRMGTDGAPIEPDDAAAALIDVLDRQAGTINGRFFRHRAELGWDLPMSQSGNTSDGN